MLTATFDTSGLKTLMVGTRHAMESGMAHAVRTGLRAGAEYARTNHKHKRRTGTLTSANNLRGELRQANGTSAWGYLINYTPYGAYVEYGTQPHDIWPKEGHGFKGPTRRGQSRREITDIGTRRVALRFTVGGRVVFARMVHHPGSKPYPFMQPAAEYAEVVIVRELENIVFPRIAHMWE